MKNFLYRIFCGFFLGISIFAPGVSGSVMAVMMGIYEKLLEIVSNPFKNLKKNIIYLFPMGIGALLSFVCFILIFSYLFETYEKATYLLFMGLIAGNLPIVFKDASKDGIKKRYIIGSIVAFAVAITVGILRLNTGESIVTDVAQISLIYLAISGAIAGASSMVPGISISMILMVLGVYNALMMAAKSIDILVIGIVGICFVVAMIAFSNVTKYVFNKFSSLAHFMVFGFMCGSLGSIFLNLPKENINFNWFVGAIMFLIGIGISMMFVMLGKKFNKEELVGKV